MFRKAAQKMREYPITSATLVGGGTILGLAGILKGMSKSEQEAVIDAAVAAEEEEKTGAGALGLSSGSLLGAAVILGMMDDEDERQRLYEQLEIDLASDYEASIRLRR